MRRFIVVLCISAPQPRIARHALPLAVFPVTGLDPPKLGWGLRFKRIYRLTGIRFKRSFLVMEFDWHDEKSARNLRERGFGFDFAALIFEGCTIEWIDNRFDYGETRIRALGEADGVVLHVVYTMRGEVCWIISARPANRKERKLWLEER